MAKSFAKVLNTTRSLNRSAQWDDQDKKAVKSAINDIMEWGDGWMEEYNPSLISKVASSLAFVSDKAHGSPTEVEYESMPTDLKDDLSYIAENRLNPNGSMTRSNLVEEAKTLWVKLSEKELDNLEKNPWRQTKYISIKWASSSINTETMTASIGTMFNDVKSGTISNKQQLKTRLQNILEVDNPNHLDYLVDDLWVDLHKNRSTAEQIALIKENYGELFWYEDRTAWQKWKTAWIGTVDGIYREFWNWMSWLTKNTPEILNVWVWATLAGNPATLPLVLWAYNSKDVDQDTQDMIDTTRATLLWKWMRDIITWYKTLDEMMDSAWDWLKWMAEWGVKFAMDENYSRGKRALEDSAEGKVWEFMWGLTVEMMATELVWGMIGEMRGGATAVKNLSWWDKFFYKMTKNTVEWGAFSAVNNAWEDMWADILFFDLLWLAWMWFSALWETSPVKTFMAKTLSGGKKVFDKMIKTAREWGETWYKNAKKKVTDLIINVLPKGTHSAEEIWKSATEELNLLSEDKKKLLGFIEGEFESKSANDVLKEIFWGTKNEVQAYWGRFYSKLEWIWGKTEAELRAEWEALQDLYKNKVQKFTASQLERIRSLWDTVVERYKQVTWALSNKADSQEFHSYLNPLKEQIQTIYKDNLNKIKWKLWGIRNTIKNWSKWAVDSTEKELADLWKDVLGEDLMSDTFGDLHDIDLQMSILTDFRNAIEWKIWESFWDRVKKKGLVTLLGWSLVAWTDYLSDWDINPSPYLVSVALLGLYGISSSPEVITTFASLYQRMSNVELAHFFKALDEWTLVTTSEKLWVDSLVSDMHKILYTDTFKWLENKLSGRDLEHKPLPKYAKKQ